MRITSEMLTEADACDNQAAIFAAEWPDGCEVTPEVAQRAVALGLDLNWAAEHLLPKTALAAYEAARATAWAAYEAARRATAWATYQAARAPAGAAFDAAEATALAACEAAMAPAWAAYEAAWATARAAYKAARAPAFVEACKMMETANAHNI